MMQPSLIFVAPIRLFENVDDIILMSPTFLSAKSSYHGPEVWYRLGTPEQSCPTSSGQNVLIEFYSDSVLRHLVIEISHCKKGSFLHELYIETRKNVNN